MEAEAYYIVAMMGFLGLIFGDTPFERIFSGAVFGINIFFAWVNR